jgi:hypothetical protein
MHEQKSEKFFDRGDRMTNKEKIKSFIEVLINGTDSGRILWTAGVDSCETVFNGRMIELHYNGTLRIQDGIGGKWPIPNMSVFTDSLEELVLSVVFKTRNLGDVIVTEEAKSYFPFCHSVVLVNKER